MEGKFVKSSPALHISKVGNCGWNLLCSYICKGGGALASSVPPTDPHSCWSLIFQLFLFFFSIQISNLSMLMLFLLNPTHDCCVSSSTSVPAFLISSGSVCTLQLFSPSFSIFSSFWGEFDAAGSPEFRGGEGRGGKGRGGEERRGIMEMVLVTGRSKKLWINWFFRCEKSNQPWLGPLVVPMSHLEKVNSQGDEICCKSQFIQSNQPKAGSKKLQKDGMALAGWWDGRWGPVLMNAKQCTQEKIALTKHTQRQL